MTSDITFSLPRRFTIASLSGMQEVSILTSRLSFHCIHMAEYFKLFTTLFSPTLSFAFKVSFGNPFQPFLTLPITSVDRFRSSSESVIEENQLSIYKHLPSSNAFSLGSLQYLLLGTDICPLYQSMYRPQYRV